MQRGVPQGSVLGPILFNLFVWDLPQVIRWSKIVMYADDVQIIFRCRKFEVDATTQLQEDINQVEEFMKANGLTINNEKTNAIHLSNNHTRLPRLLLNGQLIQFVKQARNLGVLFDDSLRFKNHVSRIVRAARWKLFKVRSLFNFLKGERLKRLIQSAVIYPLMYGSSIWGPRLRMEDLRRLQVVQNWAIKIIFGRSWTDHCSDLFAELKWTTITQLIVTKLTCLTHTASSGLLGEDLNNLFVKFDNDHGTRGNHKLFRLCTYRQEGFSSFRFTGAHYANLPPLPDIKEDNVNFRQI